VRKTAGLVAATGLLLALTACASGQAAACDPEWPEGGLADTVEVDGEFGATDLEVSLLDPLVATSTSVAILDRGDGELVRPDRNILGTLTILDASGTTLASERLVLHNSGEEPNYFVATQCAPLGSRVAAVGPANELVGADFLERNALPLAPDETMVYVIDIEAQFLTRADGAWQWPQSGLPLVSLAPDGRPGLTFSGGDAPDELRVAVLKQGDGDAVEAGDRVLMRYTGVSWQNETVFDSTWDDMTPTILEITDMSTSEDGSGLVPGFAQGIIGQRVGSQVLLAIPPEFGYPEGSSSPVAADDTMVFVVDILGIVDLD